MDDDEIAFSVRVSDQPDVLDRFRVGARFEQKGVTYRVVGHAWEMSDDNDAVVTVTGRTSPPDPAAEQARVERRRAREHREANPKHLGDMGYVPYLASSRAKVLDAKARTELLRDELDGYLGRRPWRSETETDGSGRRYWQVLRFDEEPPDLRVSMAISDVVNKLRGALDNWMFHTVKERLDTDRHDRDISFPISADEIDFDRWARADAGWTSRSEPGCGNSSRSRPCRSHWPGCGSCRTTTSTACRRRWACSPAPAASGSSTAPRRSPATSTSTRGSRRGSWPTAPATAKRHFGCRFTACGLPTAWTWCSEPTCRTRTVRRRYR
ncbi:MAG: hypothetical protein ACLGIZ_16545 [Acidimicrobiia bacterium]